MGGVLREREREREVVKEREKRDYIKNIIIVTAYSCRLPSKSSENLTYCCNRSA